MHFAADSVRTKRAILYGYLVPPDRVRLETGGDESKLSELRAQLCTCLFLDKCSSASPAPAYQRLGSDMFPIPITIIIYASSPNRNIYVVLQCILLQLSC